jgi:hypothetical protein
VSSSIAASDSLVLTVQARGPDNTALPEPFLPNSGSHLADRICQLLILSCNGGYLESGSEVFWSQQ